MLVVLLSYTHATNSVAEMARLFTAGEVISFFCDGNSEGLPEVIFPGSEDELGMSDEEDDDSEPEFEPLEVPKG